MRAKGRRRRAVVVRSGRRYIGCGLRRPPSAARAVATAVFTWAPSAALLLMLLVSAYAIEWPPQHPAVRVAPFSMQDFVAAARR